MEALGHYLVELQRPPAGWEALQQLSADARVSAERLSAEGTSVRFLRSIFVPEADSCFFLYEGASAEAVGEAGRRAALTVERVAPVVQLPNRSAKVPAREPQAGHATMSPAPAERKGRS